MVSQEPQLDQAAIWLLTFCWALARRTGTQAAQQSQGIATLLEVSPHRSLLLFLHPLGRYSTPTQPGMESDIYELYLL